ncbi:hypothetical protein K469DRAFT_12503 [Zopfia rhizophila CBS 207.26]|uniref:RapZ C-terminal domain-containing protein n=1 Tax=Zopfia rhizophila CBS 207.26 TaxID=1314779 RepID=A0A6A6ETH4_9PEZI|nr:hypothetical protein K469DRAFT_12503 [Zopfia rhizophila CBS 207.26]
MYSGVHPIIQTAVLQDLRARDASRVLINKVIRAFSLGVRAYGRNAVAMTTTCGAGTHRSVTLVQVIGKELQRTGFDIQIAHLHRVREPGDPY